MESRTRILILCLLYVACVSEVLSEELEFGARVSRAGDVEDPRVDTPIQETDGLDRQYAYKLRDKRALGLLLSGLAQIFGYTVTPIQIASLPNPSNITRPVAMSNTPTIGNIVGQQVASSRPTSMNVTAPVRKEQETIRFTGVLNFGNNSDIVGHLQRYEQIFHGRQNNMTNTIPRPISMPMSLPTIPDPGMNSVTRPPLLAPFFVKIPLPISPDLIPLMPIENIKLNLTPDVSIANEANKTAETPVRKEQEVIYKNNENKELYTVEKKNIYDEKDVMKPVNIYNHQLHIDEPSSQQNDKQQQEERVEQLKDQKVRTNCDRNTHHKEDEIIERDRNREEEIANRNPEHASNYKPTGKKKPAYDDEENDDDEKDSAERYEERNQENKSSKQHLKKDESEEEVEDDDSDKPFRGYKQPENFDKYIIGYNQQLPLGDYYHEGHPEMIRDSYGEILNNKKLEDDRIAGYLSMFKHPYVYDSQSVRNPEDASEEDERRPSTADAYEEHLTRLQKLREEYALPKNKYEEYDLNDEGEAQRDDRDHEKLQNLTSARGPKTGRVRVEDNRAKTGPPRQNILHDDAAKFETTKEEIDFGKHVPLIVPIRYIDANEKTQQATTRQLIYEDTNKLPNGRFSGNNVGSTRTLAKEKLTPQIGLPERPRKLHEGEHKELQVWPPPFDYAFDNTQPVNTIISPNSQNYPLNYYQHVKNIAANDANDNSSEQPSGYLVVVGNSANPYRNPYVYYFPNENINPQNSDYHLNTEGTYQRNQIHVPQQNTNQQFIRTNSNLTKYNLNETKRDRYHQPPEEPINVLDRYRYIFGESNPEGKESVNINVRTQTPNIENWSNKIYQSQAEQPSPVFVQLQNQNVATSNQNVQSRPLNSRYSRPLTRQKNSQPKDQRKNNKARIPQPIPTSKPFDDPQSAHDFFGFNKDDYSFAGESSDALKVAEENGKIVKESDVPVEPVVYHHESVVQHADEPENDTEKATVTEYRNKVATLKISEQRQLKPNGPIHYVDFIRNI
ncbi:uncharacterized protein DDB_G0283697-like [Nylanderia fulva]|uniref:uncharacterized protein DDB_G0283697-like n=1 Tax=Nylanderia fulva TaxID=613905 RepID=UPI0010FB277A|nr:uncharacterized protein DDB_G0283697-like [Nylanderia fulva]